MHIWITGASSGIGKATAEILLGKGYKLSLCSRRKEAMSEFDGKAFIGSCDVRDYNEVKDFVNQAETHNGPIDVLVNNAGLGMINMVFDAPVEEWQTMVDTNVKGLLHCIHAVISGMKDRGKGHIINLGSVASHNVFPRSGVYCATKHAVLAISESLRLDCSDFLKVTTISPGAVDTNFIHQTTNKDLHDAMEPGFKAGMTAEMIAEQIAYSLEYNDQSVISEIIIRPNKAKKG